MLAVFRWIELQAIRNLPIGELGDALARFSVPQLNETVVGASQKLLPILSEIQRANTLNSNCQTNYKRLLNSILKLI